MRIKKRPPAVTGEALCKEVSQVPSSAVTHENQALPNRATLARRFPALRVNRLSGRWRDDTTGARGDDVESLLVFLREGCR